MAEIQSYWEVVEPLFSIIDLSSPVAYADTRAHVPWPALILFAAHMSLAEVHNGGFLQLFWNNTGVLVPEAVEAFEALEMRRTRSIMSKAAALLGFPYPRDRDGRWEALLMATERDPGELRELFEHSSNLYSAFGKATEKLPFDSLNEELWDAAANDAGGFQWAATRYAALTRQSM